MKIAHILGSLGMGGAERVALDLAYEQKKLGHRVVAISLAEEVGGAMAETFAAAQIQVHQVRKRPGLDLTLPTRCARLLRDLDVEVAHTHNTRPLAYAAASARMAGMIVVHSKHGEGHLVSPAGRALRRVSAPFVHHFVSVSEATAEHAREQKVFPFSNRMHVITNGIRTDLHRPDAEARAEIRSELGIPDDAWVVGTVGRFDDNKNQSSLVRALSSQLGPKYQLILVGDGAAMDKVKAATKACPSPEHVHVLGRRNDAHRIVAALDVFALSSRSEGLPLVILEAMATALPVVSTDVGGIADAVEDGQSGFLVAPDDDQALGEALAHLNANPGLAREVGERARSRALEHYSAERMASEYLELYRRAR
jgi:glycosyltransferase involved in cell wall biosynthesis